MNKKKLYIWASDLSQYTGEGSLGNLFIKKKLETLYNFNIIKPKNNIIINNSFFKNRYITPILGIFYCWKLYLLKKKVCYLNYLPLWNIFIFSLLPPSTLLGPITGGSNYKKDLSFNYFVRNYLFPILYKLSIFILNKREVNTVFSTILLRKYLNEKLKKKSDFNFFLKGIKKKNTSKKKKIYDFIIYYRKHRNKQELYPIKFINNLLKANFKIIVVGDKLEIDGLKNLGFLTKNKLEKVLSKTKIFISSEENIYNFFAIDCINNNVNILTSSKPTKIGREFDSKIIYHNTKTKFKKKNILKLLQKF